MKTAPEELHCKKYLEEWHDGYPVFIGISGGTCSGKTFLASHLCQLMGEEDVNIISHDDYYNGWPHLPLEERTRINFDHPDAFDTMLLEKHLAMLKKGKKISIPIYDFKNHIRSPEYREVIPKAFNIIEGIHIFHESDLRDALDLRVYLEVSFDTMLRRRLKRDVQERGRTIDSVKNQLTSTVYPMHLQFVELYKRKAHLVIQEETTPKERVSLIINNLVYLASKPSQEAVYVKQEFEKKLEK